MQAIIFYINRFIAVLLYSQCNYRSHDLLFILTTLVIYHGHTFHIGGMYYFRFRDAPCTLVPFVCEQKNSKKYFFSKRKFGYRWGSIFEGGEEQLSASYTEAHHFEELLTAT